MCMLATCQYAFWVQRISKWPLKMWARTTNWQIAWSPFNFSELIIKCYELDSLTRGFGILWGQGWWGRKWDGRGVTREGIVWHWQGQQGLTGKSWSESQKLSHCKHLTVGGYQTGFAGLGNSLRVQSNYLNKCIEHQLMTYDFCFAYSNQPNS